MIMIITKMIITTMTIIAIIARYIIAIAVSFPSLQVGHQAGFRATCSPDVMDRFRKSTDSPALQNDVDLLFSCVSVPSSSSSSSLFYLFLYLFLNKSKFVSLCSFDLPFPLSPGPAWFFPVRCHDTLTHTLTHSRRTKGTGTSH